MVTASVFQKEQVITGRSQICNHDYHVMITEMISEAQIWRQVCIYMIDFHWYYLHSMEMLV